MKRRVIGLLLVLPAFVALLVSYVVPTYRTVRMSTQRFNLITPARDVGLDNYRQIGAEAAQSLGYAARLAILPLLIVLVVAPALAYAAYRTGRIGRRVVRLAFVVPMACCAPTVLAAAWLADGRLEFRGVGAAMWLTTVGLVCGVAVTVYLAAIRRWSAVLAVGGLLGLTTLAVAVQALAFPWLLGLGRGTGTVTTPAALAFDLGFRRFSFGLASVLMTILLATLAVLGLAAMAIVLFTRLRLEVLPAPVDEPAGWTPGRVTAAFIGGAGLLVVLTVTAYGLWPLFAHLGTSTVEADVVVNTWLPPLVSTVVGVTLAAAAGFGIGGLRPLGRWSEALLLPFAPWLFVGLGPLALANYDSARLGGRLDTFAVLVPPTWLAIPALVVFAVLARGLVASPGGFRRAALPMVAIVGAATWLVQVQELAWALLAASKDHRNGAYVLLNQLNTYGRSEIETGVALPGAAIVLFAAGLAIAQLFYLDRVVIRTGRGTPPT